MEPYVWTNGFGRLFMRDSQGRLFQITRDQYEKIKAEDDSCKNCNVRMGAGKAFVPVWNLSGAGFCLPPTCVYSNVLKCPDCGYSKVPNNTQTHKV